jgi:hypothetical protein
VKQGREIYRLIQEKTGQHPRWTDGSSEMRISCPEQCPFAGRDTDCKLYIKAYHDTDELGNITAPAGLWRCFKAKTDFCSGGGLRKLLGKDFGPEYPDYAQRAAERAIAEAAQAKRVRGYIHPGETTRLDKLEETDPAYIYWKNRGYEPAQLGSTYGVEWCFCGAGRNTTPEGRYSFDREGWLSTTHHYIIPNIMFGERISWQARSYGEPSPLLWVPTQAADLEKGIPAKGHWKTIPPGYPLRKVERPNGKMAIEGLPGDKIGVPPKYFHFFERNTTIGNFDVARQFNVLVVTEGWTKVWRVGRCAVNTFGKQITDRQLRVLGSKWNRVILLLDGDASDLYNNRPDSHNPRLIHPGYLTKLSEYTEVHGVTLEGYNDPGNAPTSEIWRQITAKTGIQEPPYNRD